MQQLPTFGHMNTLQHNLDEVIKFVCHVIDGNYDVIGFISKYRYFKKTWGSRFC